jgi:DNA-binding beta-propeller fold protein YncE
MRKIIAFTVILAAAAIPLAALGDVYRPVKEIPIGGEGGWDYVTVEPASHRLYVSHATRVVVADTETGKVVGEIPDTAGVHGFAVALDLGRGFSSNGRANTVTIVDLKTLKPLGTVATGGNPDAILYEPDRHEVYTFNGNGKSATVFEAGTGTVVATTNLGGKPEAAVYDRQAKRIFVNIEDTAEIVAIDTPSHKVAARFALTGCEEPTGLGYDATLHRLFSACANKVMTVTDSVSGKVVTSVPIGAGADGAAYDPATRLAFASNGGDGTVTIAHLDTPGKLTVVQTLPTKVSGRTMILDPVSHRIYVPAADTMPNPAGRGRPLPVTGTFKVLVFGPTP